MKVESETQFKQTEIGEIPADWEIACLGDENVTSIIMGQSPASSTYNSTKIGLPFYQGKADFGLKNPIPTKWCSEPLRIAEKGDLLLSVRAPVGDVNVASEKCCIGRGIAAIRCENKCVDEYLFYVMVFSKPRLSSFSSGAIFKAINKETLISFKIPLPPKPEQQKIAYVLSKIQKAVENQEKTISYLQELKVATMAKLFREGTRGEPLQQTEIGEIPQSWEVKTLKDVCEKPQYGYTKSSSKKAIGPRFLRITDITQNGVNWENVPFCKCSAEDFNKYQLIFGDILIARIGATTGKSFLIRECPKAIFASYLIRLRVKDGLNPEFLSYFMDSNIYWKQVGATKGQNLKGGMSGSVLSQIILPFPGGSEQQKIAHILSTIDKEMEIQNKKLNELNSLFNSVLHQLMTGKIRVNKLEIEE